MKKTLKVKRIVLSHRKLLIKLMNLKMMKIIPFSIFLIIKEVAGSQLSHPISE